MLHDIMKPIPYGRQTITESDIQAVVKVLQSDFLTQGPAVTEFEKMFAEYIGARYAVAVANGTAALHLCALALGVNEDTRVITTPITFAASGNCVLYCGGEVFFADIEKDSFLIDIAKVEKLINDHPEGYFSGIVAVDLAGYPVHLEKLKKVADKYGLWVVEDACHSPGGYFTDSKGVKQNCGNCNYADMAVFSFHPVKHIATGEGGMITTNSAELYNRLLLLRTHGITKDPSLMHENHGGWYYEMQELGYNYRLNDMQAALGSSQLQQADTNLEKRKQIAKRYDEAFAGTPVRTSVNEKGIGHAYHLYIIQVEDRAGLYNHLRQHNIFAQVHYIPMHTIPYYREHGHKNTRLPVAENYYSHCLSIPMYPSLTGEEQQYVIDKILEFVNG